MKGRPGGWWERRVAQQHLQRPGVGGERQVPQRLDERPLVADPLVHTIENEGAWAMVANQRRSVIAQPARKSSTVSAAHHCPVRVAAVESSASMSGPMSTR